jgi:mRNA interferase RelE/StbE
MPVHWSKDALLALRRCDKRELVKAKVLTLADDPESLAANVKRLSGSDYYRLRVQNWRVIFRYEGTILVVDQILPRGSAYEVKR